MDGWSIHDKSTSILLLLCPADRRQLPVPPYEVSLLLRGGGSAHPTRFYQHTTPTGESEVRKSKPTSHNLPDTIPARESKWLITSSGGGWRSPASSTLRVIHHQQGNQIMASCCCWTEMEEHPAGSYQCHTLGELEGAAYFLRVEGGEWVIGNHLPMGLSWEAQRQGADFSIGVWPE